MNYFENLTHNDNDNDDFLPHPTEQTFPLYQKDKTDC